jgi:hypothetical protein
MGIEVVLGIIASSVTLASSLGWVMDRNGRRIDKRFDSVEAKFDAVIGLVTEMRASLPLKYTLREDHFRLEEKVEKIKNDLITHQNLHKNR